MEGGRRGIRGRRRSHTDRNIALLFPLLTALDESPVLSTVFSSPEIPRT
jgi:hypothetical protein